MLPEPVTRQPQLPDEERPFVWWCALCSRSEAFSRDDLARYAREGWPVCCARQVLCYYAGAGAVEK